MRLLILGGGLAGISLAYFLQDRQDIEAIDIIEKQDTLGGLCRSFMHDGRLVDIGPHIFFSKDNETLGFMLDILGNNKHELRRSNRILHRGAMVQYPFENDLSALPAEDCERCLQGFLHNPYRDYVADNMLQFFLKTFGEGITNLYLRPYNEKIWKFDPSFMDTQMVDRIPRPPDEDIIRSANGETIDGYTHQLYFHYPITGGTQAFIDAFVSRLNGKVSTHTTAEITAVGREDNEWVVSAGDCEFRGGSIVSCIPVDVLAKTYHATSSEVQDIIGRLRYNNILIALATVRDDRAGDNFAFTIADKGVAFHRLSKVDFLGDGYHRHGTATYMMEYTYRDGDAVSLMDSAEQQSLFVDDLIKIGFIDQSSDVLAFTVENFPYAYVIYDLLHKTNMDKIRRFFTEQGIRLNGRFGNFEYWNMDRVIAESIKLAETF